MIGLKNNLIVFLLLLSIMIAHSQDSKIFWMDQSYKKIQSANIDGSEVTDVVTGVELGEGIAIDSLSTPMKLYYSESGLFRIMRVNFDGSNPEEVVTDIVGLEELDLDLINRKVYWLTDIYSTDQVQRADMDSTNSNIETLYTYSYAMHAFHGIGISPSNQWVYWTQYVYGGLDRINRINFDGTGRIIIGNYYSPRDIDVVGNKIYWSLPAEGYILRANLDGSDMDTVLTNVDTHFFTLDTTLGKIFWTESNKIKRANLDNTNMIELVTGLGNTVRGIALYYNPLTGVKKSENEFPKKYKLAQNYPNPFNPKTVISWQLEVGSDVELSVYNLLGQKVATLVSGKQKAGMHSVEWDAGHLSSGVYYYMIKAGGWSDVKKMVLVR